MADPEKGHGFDSTLMQYIRRIMERVDELIAVNMQDMALICAIHQKNQERVDELIAAGADVNSTDSNGYTAVMLAGLRGITGCLESLIKAGANTNVKFKYDYGVGTEHTALHFAARQGHKECLELLLQNGCEIDNEVIICTVLNGHSRCLEVLLKAGLDVNGTSLPLWSAAEAGRVDVMELLIQEGADVNLLRFGRTALHVQPQVDAIPPCSS